MGDQGNVDSMPDEMKDKLVTFEAALSSLETTLQPLLERPRMELFEKLEPLEMGRMDLVSAYSLNALFWMYLNVCGVNPKDHGVKQELERIRGYMNRVKEIQDKAKAPHVNTGVAKRLVKSALWQAAQKKPDESGPSTSKNSSSSSLSSLSSSLKRQHGKTESTKSKKNR